MTVIDAPGVTLRDGVTDAVEAGWAHVAVPGAAWTGAQRVAMAAEFRSARACDLCAEREAALSPYAVDGGHDAVGGLPAVAVDAVHRIATDPGRLSSRWHREFLDAGLSDAHLVDLTTVAALTAVTDTLHRALGIAPPAFPPPLPGEPTANVSSEATVHSARVPTVPLDAASGLVADFYGTRADMVPNILKSLSLCPDQLAAFFATLAHLYALGSQGVPEDWSLRRPQIELVAATVSNHNDCFY